MTTPRSTAPVSRRTALAGLGAGGLGLGLAASTRQASAQDATPAAGAGVVGSWRLTATADPAAGQPPFPALATFGADGTMLGSGPPVIQMPPESPFARIVVGAGHGAWAATGPRSVAYTFDVLASEADGSAHAVVTLSGTAELDAGGDAWAGAYAVTVVVQGGVLATATGTLAGTRLGVEPMAPPAAGTPAAATPTG